MKKFLIAGGVAALILGMSSCSGNSSTSSADKGFTDSVATYIGKVQGGYFVDRVNNLPTEDKDKFNKQSFLRALKHVLEADTADMAYYAGLEVGMGLANNLNQFAQNGLDIDRKKVYEEFSKAFLADTVSQTTMMEEQATFQTLMARAQTLMMEQQQARQQAAREAEAAKATENKEKGKAYVDEAKKNDSSIQTSESGLSYKVVKQGEGVKPQDGDRVKVKYTGKLPDGTVFDSNDSAEFPVNGVIPGFSEGLKMMNQGSEYVLYIPSEIGYGDNGTPDGSIPGGSTLTFEVEVLEVIPAAK